MSIRWNIVDRSTNKVTAVDNPVNREYVKDGKRIAAGPKQESCDGLMALIKSSSVLGMRGGSLA